MIEMRESKIWWLYSIAMIWIAFVAGKGNFWPMLFLPAIVPCWIELSVRIHKQMLKEKRNGTTS